MPKLPGGIIRALIVFIFLLIPLTFFAKEIKAQTPSPAQYDIVTKEVLNTNCPPGTIRADCIASYSFGNLLGGVSNYVYCFKDECFKQRQQGKLPSSAIDFIAYSAGQVYANPMASFSWFAQDFLANAGLAPKPVYAQGIGFSALQDLLPLWKASRNIAYSILVIVMVVIGFMIIFRMKIDPKTVISVQAALPKIIVTLLLITFSYAIVGLMIDLMYLSMSILIALIASNAPGVDLHNNVGTLQSQYMTGGLGTLFGSVFSGGLLHVIPTLLEAILIPSAINAGAVAVAAKVSTAWAFGGPLTVIIGLAIPLVLLFIIVLGLLFTSIRLILLLLNSYIQLLIALILGPLFLLQEAIPGRSAFSSWLLNVVANLSVFPATAAILLFGWVLTTNQGLVPATSNGPQPFVKPNIWVPPLLGFATTPQNIFPALLGLGIFFLAPNLVVSVKKIFQPKPTLPISAGTLLSPLTGGISTTMGAASQFYYMQQALGTGALAGVLQRFGIGGEKKPK